ncbi:MAG TPA: hypothetical protein P5081_16340 [Phycisphaerae bacterium]|nr:hypothetical protein [Phycisphaerae bacterium]HRW54441.1 hypothetical protein [Phycisphaerae bacterium]
MCDYHLEGLSRQCACPECGFRYDTHTRLWLADPTLHQRASIAFAVALLVVVVLTQVVTAGLAITIPTAVAILVLLLVIALRVLRSKRHGRRPGFACVSPEGIHYRYPLRQVRSIPWSRIRRVGVHPELIGAEVIIELSDGRSCYIAKAFGCKRDMTEFALAATQWLPAESNGAPQGAGQRVPTRSETP